MLHDSWFWYCEMFCESKYTCVVLYIVKSLTGTGKAMFWMEIGIKGYAQYQAICSKNLANNVSEYLFKFNNV